jgi:hypothetical protein
MVGQGEARRLKVDEIEPALKRFDLARKIGRNKNLAAQSVVDLPPLALGVAADVGTPASDEGHPTMQLRPQTAGTDLQAGDDAAAT